MPDMNNKSRIYLSGGGDETQSFHLDKFFFQSIPDNGSILYIPIALMGHKLYPKVDKWMRDLLELHNRNDITFDVKENLFELKNDEIIAYDAIYIGGGNTWNLMSAFRGAHFDEMLTEFLYADRIVYGGSAGAIVLGDRIDTQNDLNEFNETNVDGLGLLSGYSVTCHYKEGETFEEWAVKNDKSIICLYEESGVLLEGGVIRSVGTKPCVIFLKDGVKIELMPGENFER